MTRGRAGQGGRRRLLAVSALPPWPIRDGYSLRVAHFLSELSRGWEITLVSPPPENAAETPEGLRWRRVEGVPATDALPWREERERLVDAVRSELSGGDFDAALAWAGAEFVAGELAEFPPAVADRIDCGTLHTWRNARREAGLRLKLQLLRRAAELLFYERRAVRPFRAVVATGPADATALRRISGHERVVQIPNGVVAPDLSGLEDEAPLPTVIFTGVMAYSPNVEAVRHFAGDVWPRVRASVPDARFVVAGRSPTPEVLALEERPGVEVHADVPDMTREIRRGWIAVAPMRSGSGIKNKVLEAWAAARPVVMSEMAANGLAMDEAAGSLVAAGASEMAEMVVELLTHEELRRRLGAAGRRLAEERHGWRAVTGALDELLREAAA